MFNILPKVNHVHNYQNYAKQFCLICKFNTECICDKDTSKLNIRHPNEQLAFFKPNHLLYDLSLVTPMELRQH